MLVKRRHIKLNEVKIKREINKSVVLAVELDPIAVAIGIYRQHIAHHQGFRTNHGLAGSNRV